MPAPTAPQGTLLYAVQLAHWRARGHNSGTQIAPRRACLRLAASHGGLLRGVAVDPHIIGFVYVCEAPWQVLWLLAERALKPAPRDVVA